MFEGEKTEKAVTDSDEQARIADRDEKPGVSNLLTYYQLQLSAQSKT